MSEQLLPLHCRVCHAARACDAGQDSCCNQCRSAGNSCNGSQVCSDGEPFPLLVTRAHMLPGCELTQAERDLSCLITVPASDVNFKGALERADRDTIKAALAAIEGQPETKTKELALRRRLKTFLQEKLDTISGTNQRQDRALALNMGELEAERERQQQEKAEQADREKRIAEAHEIAGRIQAFTFVEKVLTVSTLMQLKGIKESKAYRDLPNMGTWDKYCEYIGFSRQKVDMDLQNLAEFGEQFLLTVGSFGLGYREMRQLRQLQYDGESFRVSEDGKTVIIEGEAIPLGDDGAAPLIEGALEKLLIKNKTLADRNKKLEKEFKAAVKEETHGLETEKKALVERVKTLERYEPAAHDETWCEEQMTEIANDTCSLSLSISSFIVDPRLTGDRAAQAAVLKHLTHAQNLLHDLRERFETAFSTGE